MSTKNISLDFINDYLNVINGTPLVVEEIHDVIEEGTSFTNDQLEKLRNAYSNIKGVDPTSESGKKFLGYFDGLSPIQLKQLAEIKPPIPFVSKIAATRLIKIKNK